MFTSFRSLIDLGSSLSVEFNIYWYEAYSFPVAQLVEHGVSNAKIMGSIPRESKSW